MINEEVSYMAKMKCSVSFVQIQIESNRRGVKTKEKEQKPCVHGLNHFGQQGLQLPGSPISLELLKNKVKSTTNQTHKD